MSRHATALIDPTAELHDSVTVGPYAVIGPGTILREGVSIGAHAVVHRDTTLGAGCAVHAHAVLGGDPQDLKYAGEPTRLEVGTGNIFREFTTANRGTAQGGGVTRIGDDNLFMAYSHVAHDCLVGSRCVLANSVALAGHVEVHDNVVLAGLSGVHQYSRVGRCSMVGGGAMAAQDVPPFTIVQGDRARVYGLNIVGLRRAGFPLEVITALKGAYRELFHQGLPLRIALEQVREFYLEVAEVQELVTFIESSTRGVCRAVGADEGRES